MRFRNKKLHSCGDNTNNRFFIENECNNNNKEYEITVKKVLMSSFGLRVLRSCYALVVLLVCGFLFAFCFQVVLFLFLFFILALDCDM